MEIGFMKKSFTRFSFVRMSVLLFMLSFFVTDIVAKGDRSTIIVQLKETGTSKNKIDIINSKNTEELVRKIQALIDSGCHIVSLTPAQFGNIVIYTEYNGQGKQLAAVCKSHEDKKIVKEYSKQGYFLDVYRPYLDVAIFRKKPNVTKQEFKKYDYLSEKKLEKYNKKGMRVVVLEDGHYCVEDGAGDIRQTFLSHFTTSEFLNEYNGKSSNWTLTSIVSSTGLRDLHYKSYYEYTDTVIKERLRVLSTLEQFEAFLKEYKTPNNEINVYCGYSRSSELHDHIDASIAESEGMSALDVFTGLTSSVLGLINGPGSSTAGSSSTDDDSSIVTEEGTAKAKRSGASAKCRYCGGNGTCTAKTAAGRKNACSGSGLCGWCSGTGWNSAGGSRVKCTACDGKGRCKSCGGTGKCKHCNGKGH